MTKIRRVRIHFGRRARPLQLFEYRGLMVILLEQRGRILRFIARDHHLPQAFQFADQRRMGCRARLGEIGQSGLHSLEQSALFVHNRIVQRRLQLFQLVTPLLFEILP